jgi:hypothetical protein
VRRDALPKLFGGRKRGVIATDAAGELRPIPFTSASDVLLGNGTFGAAGAAVIANDSVTNAKLANMAQARIKGRAVGAGTGDPTDLTPAEVREIIDARAVLEFTFESEAAGTPIAAGLDCWVRVPQGHDVVLDRSSVAADQVGDLELDIQVDTHANFPPDASDSIVGATPPELTADLTYEDTALGDWTPILVEGDWVRVVVISCTDIERFVLALEGSAY